jgi:hypothetical protein
MSLRVLSSLVFALGLASGAHAATVFSDDFESGAISGSTAYTLLPPGGMSSPGDYGVVSDPAAAYTNGFLSSFDHTVGTASGHMQFFDGADTPVAIWSQTAVLTAGTTYTVDYWSTWAVLAPPLRPSVGGNPLAPVTQLLVDGAASGAAIQTDSTWQTSSFTFVADHTGSYTFSIVDTNVVAYGNDGALDDIRLSTSVVPEPGSTALLLAGLGALGLAARRRRG